MMRPMKLRIWVCEGVGCEEDALGKLDCVLELGDSSTVHCVS